MSNIKKHINDSWSVLASGQATGIAVDNPKLLDGEEQVTSVDAILERHEEDINKLYRNVAWLALNGGGGSGGGSGSGGDISEATCKILVNGEVDGSTVVMDSNGLKIELTEINVALRKNWTVIVRVGATQIAQASLSYGNNIVSIPIKNISSSLNNHIGNLSISASYEDEANGIYGAVKWSGTVIESEVNINTTPLSTSFNMDDIDTAQIVYDYSVGVVGKYNLIIEVFRNNSLHNIIEDEISIPTTSVSNYVVKIADLLKINSESDELKVAGVYNIKTTLRSVDNNLISGSIDHNVTIVSDKILLSTTIMSSDINNPVNVNMNGSININYTAYLQGYKSFTYKYIIGTGNGDVVIKENGVGYFGEVVNEYLSVYNKEWVKEGAVMSLKIVIDANDKKEEFVYYIKFVTSSDTFLKFSDTTQVHLASEFLARNYNTGDDEFNLIQSNYINGGKYYNIQSKLGLINGNYLSCINTEKNGTPYLRLSNGAFAKLDGWTFNNHTYKLRDFIDITKSFTISVCFKADYHPDDNRTILCCGDVDANTGEIDKGISINVHDIIINGVSKVKLTDNAINMVDITCMALDIYDASIDKTIREYLIKVYLDGVLSSVDRVSDFISLGDAIFLGGKEYNGKDGLVQDYLCDCNIYNLQVFDNALNDLDIMTNHINNKASTSYVNNQPNFKLIDLELSKNFSNRDADGNVSSMLFKNGQYDISFLIEATSEGDSLSENALNEFAKTLGIPIMLIDVSSHTSWTFNAFVTQQSAQGNGSLDPVGGNRVQYWDPTGNNNSVISIKDCEIELQGTSTLNDAVKNINITVPKTTAFIPKKTWLPEQTYTLKADVVDSSHSNNASIGGFINSVLGDRNDTYYPYDETAKDNVYGSKYFKDQQPTATLKHTVEGFPVLLIMKFNKSTSSDKVDITPLGIYSFNLGRDAHRNLGFKKLNSIKDKDGIAPPFAMFPSLIEDATFDEVDTNANWIEIKNTSSIADMVKFDGLNLPEDFNSAEGDFWQNDDNILNYRYEVRYGNKKPSEYANFKNFVEQIMSLPIEGTYSTLSAPVDGTNTIIPQVIGTSYDLYTMPENGTIFVKKGNEKWNIISDVNSITKLSYNEDSFYKYFVVGLLFGLVDNFGKNSTYRSWGEAGQYFIDFYDMDTALGGDNQGQLNVGPDTWIKYLRNSNTADGEYGYVCETYDSEKKLSGNVVSANHNKLWISLDTNFYRQYKSSIVKSIYTQYWYDLRQRLHQLAVDSGYNDFVDYFIDEYYIKQTGECGSLLFNYDYKLKYLLQFTEDSFVSSKDLTKLHGRKIAYARDWLKKHILFLDSVFNWRDSAQAMLFKNNVNNRSSSSVYNTPDKFYLTSNTPLIINHSVGNSTDTLYFAPKNQEIVVNAGANSSNSILNWNFSNSSNIIKLGNDENPLKNMNISILNYAQGSTNNWDVMGLPSVTELNLSNNSTFGAGFSLDVFEQGAISELRSLNFAKTSGAGFSLNLNKRTADGDVFTKYTKLTNIDISESKCVTDLDIPSIPLKNLKVHNSTITTFKLNEQKYLSNIDLTGCTKLTEIEIKSCDSYTDFTISNLTNLKSVALLNCPNLKNVRIENCPNLTVINIEGCSNLTSITINKCNNLIGDSSSNYLTIAGCTKLTSLNLYNNPNLVTFKITNSNQSNITYLNISDTLVKYITGDNVDTSILDLYAFNSLTTFSCTRDSNVSHIQFANQYDKSKGVDRPIILNSSFYECTGLERIYGYVKLYHASYSNISGLFRGCTKFSIHGSGATKWNNKNIYSGTRIRTVWEIIKDNTIGTGYNDVTYSDLVQSGKTVTNMILGNGSVLSYLFSGTNITQFDAYYILSVFALSPDTSSQSIDNTFYSLSNSGMFDWSKGCHPDRYMFYKCSKITSISHGFKSIGTTLLLSPEEGKDNGLFSPLVNATGIYAPFTGTTTFSRKLFWRTSGNYKIRSIDWLYVVNVFDDDSDFPTYTDYSNRGSKLNKLGNFTDFFKNLTAFNSIYAWTNDIEYLDFDTLIFPGTTTGINYSFNITYGKGTLDLEKMFPNGSNVTSLCNCFKVYSSNANYGTRAAMPIKNSTLRTLPNIQYIGYGASTAAEYGSATNTSFSGGGLRKYIDQDTFPESIVSGCKNLIAFGGFFKNVENKEMPVFKFPGDMFKNNSRLERIGGLLYNAKFAYTLSSGGFENCKNLRDVSYMCYFDLSSTNRSKLSGYIPHKFFYHGFSNGSTIYKGTNQESQPDSENVNVNTLEQYTVTYNNYNKNITNMEYCFRGCTGLEPYVNKSVESYVENNSNYQPFKWMYNEASKSWIERSDSFLKDASWGYDGDPSTRNSAYKYLESSDISEIKNNATHTQTINYCCAPDLLRYCTNTSGTAVHGLFADCGLNYSSSSGGNIPNNENLWSIGLMGRIPSYLLQPVSNITNIQEMFKFCRKLSSYKNSDNYIYLIPEDFFKYATKITNLIKSFQGLSVTYGTRLDVFSHLSGSLDIRCMFANTYFGSDSENSSNIYTYSGVFANNNISKVSGLFSYWDLLMNSSTLGVYVQNPNNGQITSVSNSIKFKDLFSTNKLPAQSNIGYVYYGWGTTRASDKDIPNKNQNY